MNIRFAALALAAAFALAALLAASPQAVRNEFQIDFGLATAGNALQQVAAEPRVFGAVFLGQTTRSRR